MLTETQETLRQHMDYHREHSMHDGEFKNNVMARYWTKKGLNELSNAPFRVADDGLDHFIHYGEFTLEELQ